jgi:hypothetical protein
MLKLISAGMCAMSGNLICSFVKGFEDNNVLSNTLLASI